MSSGLATEISTRALPDGPEAIWAALRATGIVIVKAAATAPETFAAFTEQFAERFHVHQDPSRRRYAGDDTTQGVASGAAFIDLHAERSYLPAPPELLFFCCATPSLSGGATTVCDGAAIVATLAPEDAARLDVTRLVWRTRLERPMWQRMWGSEDPQRAVTLLAAEAARAGRDGAHGAASCWCDGDALEVRHDTPAISRGWIGTRPAFANYLLLARHEPDGPTAAQPDGQPIPRDLVERAGRAAEALTVDIGWERGDVAIIDNTRCLHGRRAFTGGDRQILVRMGHATARWRSTV